MTAKKTPSPVVKCPHHWMIEVPDGPTSGGACRDCGATKTFTNIPNGLWDMKPWELR